MSPTISAAGDAGILVRFGDQLGVATTRRVLGALAALDRARGPGWLDLMPGYASVLVVFDPVVTSPDTVEAAVAAALAGAPEEAPVPPRRHEIPVLYHPDVAPDLAALAAEKRLSVESLVELHTAPLYRCAMLGFRPGFPFLIGLPDRLRTPRLGTPRVNVPAGAVAIAGRQTGIYPCAGPGGWRVVGRTPSRLYQPTRTDPFLIAPGDEVKFVAVDRATFARLESIPT